MRQLTYGSLFSGVECMSAAAIGLPLVPRFFAEVEPFPCAVLRSKFPNVPNLGDVTKIKYDSERKELSNGYGTAVDLRDGLDVLVGGSPCFVAGTLVLTPSGYRPIEDLKVGDEVVGGKTGEIRRVEAVGSKVAPVGRIKVLGRPPITCTHDHPFYCIDMKRDGCSKSATYGKMLPQGDYAKVHAEDAVGKYAGRVKIPDVLTEHATPKVGSLTHAEVLNLAGWYVGDGCIHRWKGKSKKSVMLALYSAKKIGKFRSLYDGKVSFYVTADGKVEVYGTAFADWLVANFGEHSTDKTVPYWLYSDSAKQDFLLGYLATDGCTIGTMRQFVSVSPRLAYGVADLIGSAAVSVRRVPPKGVIKGREVNQHDGFTVRWHRQSAKTKLIHGRYASIVRNFKNDGTTTARVFNITVSEEHTYVVEGVCCFNCQDFSVAGKRAGADSELLNDGGTTRSSLIFTYIRLLREIRPRWIVYENVPGLLTSNEGRDFAHFLVALAQCGYGDFAWRVLDAQYVRVDGMERAVPQRRRRVWLVGHLGENHRRSAEVLLEPYGNPGDLPPRRKTWEEIAGSLAQRPGLHDRMVEGRWRPVGDGLERSGGMNGFRSGAFAQFVPDAVSGTLDCEHMNCVGNGTPCIVVDSSEDIRGQVLSTVENHKSASRVKETDVAPTIGATRNLGVGNDNPLVVEKTSDCGRSVCYDGYNQRVYDEVCMTVRSAATGTDGNDADPKVCVSRAYGMNPKNGSQMVPCSEEVSQTLAVEHTAGVVAPTGPNCLNPADPQSKRVFREDGVMDTLPAMEGGGCNNQAVMVERKSTCLTPDDPLQKRVYTADGAAPTLLSIAKNSGVSAQAFVTKGVADGDEPLPEIVVRRLTPFECESLMGLPQGWTVPSFTEDQIADPTLIAYFRRVHDDWQRMNADEGKTPKPKTDSFVRDWLTRISDPATCPDAPRFKACGNGWAVNCPRWIILNLLRNEGIDPWYPEDGVVDDAVAGKDSE